MNELDRAIANRNDHLARCGLGRSASFERSCCDMGRQMMRDMSNTLELPTTKEQYREAATWASLLWQADYPAELHGTGQDAPFHQEWRVFGPGWHGPQVATIDIDGTGASWHGPDDLWLEVIGSKVGVTS